MVRTRFAPSPTGIPHLGNTRTALYNYLFAKHNKGKFILRIEDTDQTRLVPGSLSKILKILESVGIKWDEGPAVNGPFRPYIQSKRLAIYQQHAKQLIDSGHAYYCFCTQDRLKQMRVDQQKKKQLPRYDQHCLSLSSSEVKKMMTQNTPYVVRLKTPQAGVTGWYDLIQGKIEFKNNLIDDQVLLKSDGYPTYHLAVVVDDYLMKISHILRGVEWISSTPKHLLLYRAFNWEIPQIGHFPVILGPDKAKLSKRHGAKSILDYLNEGYLPEPLITFMAYLGWSFSDNSELLTLDKLVSHFDLDKVQTANPIFDIQKLDYFNAKYIRSLPLKKLIQLIKPFLKFKISSDNLTKIIPLIQDRLVRLTDINQLISYFVSQPDIQAQAILQESKLTSKETVEYLKKVVGVIDALQTWSVQSIEDSLHRLQLKLNLKPRPAFMTIRLSVTGSSATPPLFDLLYILGKQTVIKRLKHAQKSL